MSIIEHFCIKSAKASLSKIPEKKLGGIQVQKCQFHIFPKMWDVGLYVRPTLYLLCLQSHTVASMPQPARN